MIFNTISNKSRGSTTQYNPIPSIAIQCHLIPPTFITTNTRDHHPIPFNKIQFHPLPFFTITNNSQFYILQSNSIQYHQYHPKPSYNIQYHSVQHITFQYNTLLFNTIHPPLVLLSGLYFGYYVPLVCSA